MSSFGVYEMPGGEIIISRTLTRESDGVDDHEQFLLRYDDQKALVKFLIKARPSWCVVPP